ncbi:hypothetical protein GCM10010149_17190 [Nonomuraea roseoviolacea subsp. roseoviolacea]|uniref:hypothetical protein n=1 Tax=Nonomuraea roseoviolacea TaxID=103837 RepID=UPI0031D5EE09
MAYTWMLRPDYRTPPAPAGEGVPAGPWRHADNGQVMNGVYERFLPGRRIEVVAIWYGYVLSRCDGPRMPRFTSPLVSAWNPVLAQGLTAGPTAPSPYRDEHWCDRWIAEALLYGRKPFGVFTLPVEEAMRWFARSGGTALVYRARHAGEGLVRVVAGSSEPYGRLFDMDALIADYRRALPGDLGEEEAEALAAHRASSPALGYVLSDDAEGSFRRAPLSVRGLTLGYPPPETAARILAEKGARIGV